MHLLVMSAALTAALPPELGDVQWQRDFTAATKTAEKVDKPLLVLFDEVPGCQTCVRYGQSALRHPLLVEAAETAFVPVAVYNNVGGADREVLNRFREPTWNNPVVRIVDSAGRDLAPRLAGDYRPEALAARMVIALERAKQPVPEYLRLVAAESERTSTLYVGMYCFWSGEACLGDVEDVLATRTGWMGGTEVVELKVRKGREGPVLQTAKAKGCAKVAFGGPEIQSLARSAGLTARRLERFRATPGDDLHTLRRTRWRALPLTDLQSSRVNAALAHGERPSRWLSPRQAALVGKIREPKGLPDPRHAASLADAQAALRAALGETDG